MKKTIRAFWRALPLLTCAAALLIIPDVTTQAARDGLRLCAQVLVPSLFPFFVCAKLIVSIRAAEPLEQLLAPLADPAVAAVGGRQIARPEARPYERLVRTFNYPE